MMTNCIFYDDFNLIRNSYTFQVNKVFVDIGIHTTLKMCTHSICNFIYKLAFVKRCTHVFKMCTYSDDISVNNNYTNLFLHKNIHSLR